MFGLNLFKGSFKKELEQSAKTVNFLFPLLNNDGMVSTEKILTGNKKWNLEKWRKIFKINETFANNLLRVIEDPVECIFLLDDLINGFKKLSASAKKEVRMSLIRIQIACSINTPSNPAKATKQIFVSEVLEKLFFGSNLLSSEEEKLIESKKID